MPYMLVRNTVSDFDTWKAVFDEQGPAAAEAGFDLIHLWRSMDDPHEVFFLLRFDEVKRARAYLEAPHQPGVGERAGVTDGEIWYLQDVP